jgi:hypothetical protein
MKDFFSNLFHGLAGNPKTTIAGAASIAAIFLPKYAPLITAVSAAAVGALANDAKAPAPASVDAAQKSK